ncbi:MAG: hypothetical protein CML20_19145 [Rheinheimera sp.]|nr:hypothetical protein [Rheinheimera sp.]
MAFANCSKTGIVQTVAIDNKGQKLSTKQTGDSWQDSACSTESTPNYMAHFLGVNPPGPRCEV